MASTEFTSRGRVGKVVIIMNWATWVGGATCLVLAFTIMLLKYLRIDSRELVLMEWNHPMRCYFFVAQLVAILMLCLGAPKEVWDQVAGRVICIICFILQILFTMNYYSRWMYSKSGNLSKAGAPFLLSVVNWFLITILC